MKVLAAIGGSGLLLIGMTLAMLTITEVVVWP